MARDVRQYGDVQIDYWLSQPGISPELKAELLAEKARRAAPNVQSNLDAAATPITPEPVAGEPKKWQDMTRNEILAPIYDMQGNPLPDVDTASPEELDAYGQKYRKAVSDKYDAGIAGYNQARKIGYEDPEQLAYNAAHGVQPEDYVAAGRPMPLAYRDMPPAPLDSVGRVDAYFADKAKRSESGHILPQYRQPTADKMAADESQQQVRANAQKNIATYGSSYATATDAQRGERANREQSENDMRGTRIDGIINRLASQTGTPRSEIRARLKELETPDKKGKKAIDLDDGLSPQEVAMLGQPFTDEARDRRDMEVAADRAFNKRRGRMAGSNLRANAANNWNDMPADWQNFVRAGGKGATPLDVEGRQLEQAARWAGQAVTGAIAGGAGADTALKVQQERRLQGLRALAGKAKHDSWGGYARQDAEEVLDREGASPEEKQMILDELFGQGSAAGRPAGRPDPTAPLPLPEGHGNPGRMPDGMYPMM